MSMSRSPSREGSAQPESRVAPGNSTLGLRSGAASASGASGSGVGEELLRKGRLPGARGSVGPQQQPTLEAVAEEQAKEAKGKCCAYCDCTPGCSRERQCGQQQHADPGGSCRGTGHAGCCLPANYVHCMEAVKVGVRDGQHPVWVRAAS